MNADDFARRSLFKLGVKSEATFPLRLLRFMETTPPTDPRRQRIEQFLHLARERQAQAHCLAVFSPYLGGSKR